MLTWRVLPPERVAEVTTRLAGLRWSWTAAELDHVLAVLGWRAVATATRGALLATGLDPMDGRADLELPYEGVGGIVVPVTDPTGEDAEGTARRRDAFAMAVGAVAAVVGAPTLRRPGPRPEVRWYGPSGVLRVADPGSYVELSLLSLRYADLIDESAAPLDDDTDEELW